MIENIIATNVVMVLLIVFAFARHFSICRSAIWESNFRPFMDERARRKQAKEESELARAGAGGRVGKRKYSRRDSNRESASEAVLQGFAVKKTSKKINYDRLEVAFTPDGNFKVGGSVIVGLLIPFIFYISWFLYIVY